MARSKDRRPGFSRRAQYSVFLAYVIAIAGAVVGAVLLVVSAINPSAFAAFRSGVAEVTSPVSGGLAAVVRSVGAVPDTIGSYFRVHAENDALRREVIAQRKVIQHARIVSYDNLHLRKLLALRDGDTGIVVNARIVSTTASSTRRFGLLNAGLWQGVRTEQPVIGPNGLVGRVVEAGPNTARVLLVTDPESIVPVRRTRDGLPAIAAGRGDGLVDIRAVDVVDVTLMPGDMFVTSGTGGLFAPGIPVARVRTRARDTAPATPFAHPDTLDFASVGRVFLSPPPPPATRTSPAPAPAAPPGAAP